MCVCLETPTVKDVCVGCSSVYMDMQARCRISAYSGGRSVEEREMAFTLIGRIHLGELGSVWNLRSGASLSV